MSKEDLLVEDWTGSVLNNINNIKFALWVLILMEIARFVWH